MVFASMPDISRINEIGASQNGLLNKSLNKMRNDFNYGFILGGGLKYKVGINYIVLNIRYTRGINNLVSSEKRYSNHELLYTFGYVDNDFRMDNLAISFGIERAFYKSKKQKR